MQLEAPWPLSIEHPGGRALVEELGPLSLPEREARLEASLFAGHLPTFLSTFATFEVRGVDARGRDRIVELAAMVDYLALGTGDDYVRVPLSPRLAQLLANRWRLVLPTPRLVDLVHRHAAARLEDHALSYKHQKVETLEAVLEHEALVLADRAQHLPVAPLGRLVSGHKKDIVLTTQLARAEHQGRVAVYGWHGTGETPHQALSLVRSADYVEYTHGVRLFAAECLVDGRPFALREVMQDAALHKLVSDEGPVPTTLGYPTRWQPMRTRRR